MNSDRTAHVLGSAYVHILLEARRRNAEAGRSGADFTEIYYNKSRYI